MKKIIALTDFSENSVHAARFAAMLAGRLHKKLTLYHTHIPAPVIPSYAGAPWFAQDMVYAQTRRMAALERVAEDIRIENDEESQVEIIAAEGPLTGNLRKLLGHPDIEMVVMGAGTSSRIDHFLNGRDTMAVIRSSACPVLVVPGVTRADAIHKIIFATAFQPGDLQAARYLINMAKVLKARLVVVHVLPLRGSDPDEQQQTKFLGLLNHVKYPNITYHRIRGKSIPARLEAEVGASGADLLALVHYDHRFLAELFSTGTVRRSLADQHLPVLVFSGRKKEGGDT